MTFISPIDLLGSQNTMLPKFPRSLPITQKPPINEEIPKRTVNQNKTAGMITEQL